MLRGAGSVVVPSALTQVTRPGAQTWIWSTRGDANSTWFHGLVDKGLAGTPGICIVDFGIPAGTKADLDTIVAHHPAARAPEK